MSVSDVIREVNEDSGKEGLLSTDEKDIIEFVESDDGLGFKGLYPVQRFILKAFYNLELDDDNDYIRIPKTWRCAQSENDSDYYHFTEQEYLEYLYQNGRCNVDSIDHDRHELILPIGRRSGKCIRPDSLVLTDEGILEIGSLGDLDGEKVQHCEVEVAQEGPENRAHSDQFYNGEVRDTKEIVTRCGYDIEGTLNHRVRVLSEDGEVEWRYLEDVEEGDRVCLHRNTDLWTDEGPDLTEYHHDRGRKEFDFPDTLNQRWGEFLGLLCGDGTRNIDDRVEVTVPYPELEERSTSLFEDLLGGCNVYEDDRNETTCSYHCQGPARQFLSDIGWDTHPDEKSLPWSVLQSPKEVVSSFLSGLFEVDGMVDEERGSVSISGKDRRFLSDVQTVLLNFGIISSLHSEEVDGWRLSVEEYDSKCRFLSEIGFLTDRKEGLLSKRLEYGASDTPVREEGEDYFFDQVESVENSRSKVVDLSVPDGHNFVANGFTNHNTFLSGIIAAYETYKLLRKGNPHKYYGIPEGNTIQICSVATATDQSKILYQEAKRHFNTCEYFKKYRAKSTQSEVEFQTKRDIQKTGKADEGGDKSVRLTFYSSVSSGIRGASNIVVIMDEAAFFAKSGESSASAVYEAVSPSVATFSPKDPDDPTTPLGDSEGRILMISSPYAKEGLFYDLYRKAKMGAEGTDDILVVQAPTWEVNPTISLEYFKKEYGKDPRAFSREFGAQFSDRVQTWIDREEDLQVCIDEDLKPSKKGQAKDPHFLGLDLGVKNHRTAVCLTKPEGDKVALQYHEEWQAGKHWDELNPHLEEPMVEYPSRMIDQDTLDFEEIAEWIEELSRRFYISKGVFDQFQGLSFEQALHRKGLSQIEMENFSIRETSDMYQAFRDLMFHEKLLLYDYALEDRFYEDGHAPYINELLELQSESKGKKKIEVSAPNARGKYDDFSDALMRSVWLTYKEVLEDGPKVSRGSSTSQNVTMGGSPGDSPNYAPRTARMNRIRKRRNGNNIPERDPNRDRKIRKRRGLD